MFRCLGLLLLLISAIAFSGCSEMGMDITDGIVIQETILEDNVDANDASSCILSYDTGLERVDEEFVDTIELQLVKDCIQDVADNIFQRSTDKDDP